MDGSSAIVGDDHDASLQMQTEDFSVSDWMSLDDASSGFELPTVDSDVLSPNRIVSDSGAGFPDRTFGSDESSAYSAVPVLHMEALRHRATVDFLTKTDVAAVLANIERLGMHISADAVQMPPSGTLVFYNKKVTKRFRDDGYAWRKKKDGRSVQEYHEKLKIDGVTVLTVCYTKLADDAEFQRRVYWLLEKERSHWVLVHYLRKRSVAPTARARAVGMTAALTPGQSGRSGRQSPQLGQPLDSALSPEAELAAAPLMGTPVEADAAAPESAVVPNTVMPAATVTHAGATPMQDGEVAGPPSTERPIIQLVDCSPDWAYVTGGEKVIVIHDVAPALAVENSDARWDYYCSFGRVTVAAQLIRPGVVRCEVPPAPLDIPGVVPLQLHAIQHAESHSAAGARTSAVLETPEATSNAWEFTYRRRPSLAGDGRFISVADEKEFYVRMLRTIGGVTGNMQHSQTHYEPEPQWPPQSQSQQQQQQQQQQRLPMKDAPQASSAGAAGSQTAVAEKDQARSAALALMVNLIELVTDNNSSKPDVANGTPNHTQRAVLGAADSDGLTVLHYAAALGFVEVVGMLLARGVVEANHADNEGCTAMHWASAHGHEPVVALLLEAGATQLKNNDGLTPLDLALREQSPSSDDTALALVMSSFRRLDVVATSTGNLGDTALSADTAVPSQPDFSRRDSMGTVPSLPCIPENERSEGMDRSASSSLDALPRAKSGQSSPDIGALCAEEDQATLSQFMQISHTLVERQAVADLVNPAAIDLDPDVVNVLQRNARSVLARRRFERLRNTTVKLQSTVRARRGQQQEQRIEGAARLVQSRFRQSRKQRHAGGIRTKQHAKAAHVIQAHVRAYLTAQDELTQRQRQRAAVSTIEDRVKMWLSIRRAVAEELQAEVYSTHSETSDSFYSDSDYSELDRELAEREAAVTIQAEVTDWMRTKHAASVIQRNVRSWLDQQEPDGAVETAMQLSMRQQQTRVAMLTGAPRQFAAAPGLVATEGHVTQGHP